MSSIRPLATITLLACVGVVLYMKINETEPTLPPEMEADWSVPPAIEAIEFGLVDEGQATHGTQAHAQATTAPGFGSAAPAWAPETAAPAAPPAAAGQPPLDTVPAYASESSAVARSASEPPELPELPPLPAMPGDSSPSAVHAATEAAMPYASTDVAAAAAVPPASTPESSLGSGSPYAAPAEAAGDPGAAVGGNYRQEYGQQYSQDYRSASGAELDPNAILPTPTTGSEGSSLFATAWLEVQAALDRGELSQALLKLSDWRHDPSLTPEQNRQVEELLGQLAGSVIYEGPPSHRLESRYLAQAGESLVDVGERFNVPWQLLAKINGIADPNELRAGQELKVVRGPFSAVIDLSRRELTLMLDRRYAGRFDIELSADTSLEEGTWKVDQKLLTPGGSVSYGASLPGGGEDRSLVLANVSSPTGSTAVLRGPGNNDPAAIQPRGRMLRLSSRDIADVYDILSVGSRVTVRR